VEEATYSAVISFGVMAFLFIGKMNNLPLRTNEGFYEPGYLSSVIEKELVY